MLYILPKDLLVDMKEIEKVNGETLSIRIEVNKLHPDDNDVCVRTWNTIKGETYIIAETLEDDNTECLVNVLGEMFDRKFSDVDVRYTENVHYYNEYSDELF